MHGKYVHVLVIYIIYESLPLKLLQYNKTYLKQLLIYTYTKTVLTISNLIQMLSEREKIPTLKCLLKEENWHQHLVMLLLPLTFIDHLSSTMELSSLHLMLHSASCLVASCAFRPCRYVSHAANLT